MIAEHGGSVMSQEKAKEKPAIPQQEETVRLLERAIQGDEAVVPEVRKLLDTHPSIWQTYGNLPARAEKILVDAIAGKDLLLAESLRRQVDAKKEELGIAAASPLERMQIERIAITLLQINHLDALVAQSGTRDADRQKVLQKRHDAANRQHQDAIKALALLRKLLPAATPRATGPRLADTERSSA
jgi:hypothetical protein